MEIDLNEIVKKIQDIREKAEEEIEDKKNEVLKNMLDLDHVKVDVHIEGIVKEKEPVLHGN